MVPKPSGALSPSAPNPSTATRPWTTNSVTVGSTARPRRPRSGTRAPCADSAAPRGESQASAPVRGHAPTVDRLITQAVGPKKIQRDRDREDQRQGNRHGINVSIHRYKLHVGLGANAALEVAIEPAEEEL